MKLAVTLRPNRSIPPERLSYPVSPPQHTPPYPAMAPDSSRSPLAAWTLDFQDISSKYVLDAYSGPC